MSTHSPRTLGQPRKLNRCFRDHLRKLCRVSGPVCHCKGPALADFIQRTVGQPLAEAHLPAIEALSRIFSAHAPVSAGDDEEGEEEEPDAAELAEMAARAAAGGSSTLFDDGGLSDEVLASLPLDEPPASWEDAE